jgi:hypothetical protein
MLWKPVTDGEDLFLRLFEGLGNRIDVRGPNDAGLTFLVSANRFIEFTKLVATLEVFLRCIFHAKTFDTTEGHLPATHLGSILGRELGLPGRICADRAFCETAKQAGQVAARGVRNKRIEADATADAPRSCYLCGIALTRSVGAPTQFTVDHIWPLSLGGATVDGNLLPACKHCNDTRQHCITWAWGPVQSTYEAQSPRQLPRDLRVSLTLARLMLMAARTSSRGRLLTLKEAARRLRTVATPVTLLPDRRYVYFELFQQIEGHCE